MQLELKDEKGVIGTIELPLEQIKEVLGSGSASGESEVQLKESQGKVAELEEKLGQVAQLEEKLAAAEGRTMDDFTPVEKADFVIAWGRGLSPENKAVFAQAVGIPIAGASAAEVAEVEGEPKTIQGKTDKPGYKYYEYLNISMRE